MASHEGRLAGKAAIVTGGATGIGEAICHKFAREGARVVVAGLADDPVDDVVRAIQKQYGANSAVGHKGDVSEERAARSCVDRAVEEFGTLDVLVNNAGVFLFTGELQDYPLDEFVALTRLALGIASERVRARYGFPCGRAQAQLARIEEGAQRQEPGTVHVEAFED